MVQEIVENAQPFGPNVPLDAVRDFIARFVVATDHQLDAVVLWVAHTHAIDAAETTPYLAVRSAEKRSGKSRLLEVLELLVAQPMRTENVSVAALAHSLDAGSTLLLDETDTIFGRGKSNGEIQETLRGVLDSGHRRGGSYVRMSGQGANMSPRSFSTFGAKVLSGIGELPGTLADRAIDVVLKRRTAMEHVEPFRFRKARAASEPLRARLMEWAASATRLQDARPETPPELDDRAADGWEPLCAIADLAEGDWPNRARAAAVALSTGAAREDESLGVQLLTDTRAVMGDRDRISSAELVRRLSALDAAPWGVEGGKPITQYALAKLLKPYGVRPRTIREDDGRTPKGYRASDFVDAFSRYVPLQNATPPQRLNTRAPGQEASATPIPLVADGNAPGAPGHRRVADVAVKIVGHKGEDDSADDEMETIPWE